MRIALQNAASVAGLLVTTEAMVAEKPEPKPAMPAGAPGGGMGGMESKYRAYQKKLNKPLK